MNAIPWRDLARYAPLSVLGGGLFGIAISGFRWNVRGFLHGGLIGFTCFAFAVLAEAMLHRWLEERPEAWWRRALTYFLASQAGWPIGLFLGMPLIHGQPMSALRLPERAIAVILITSVGGPLAGLAAYAYERLKDRLRVSIEQLKEKEFADKELELARELQSRMLPAPEIAGDGYRLSARNLAARYVAGDFYDVFHYADGSVGVAIADVAGKGMAASLIMASCKAVLPLLAANREVDEAATALNEKLSAELSKREFVALALARYEPASGRVTFVNAGLPDPYLLRGALAEPQEADGPRLPLGVMRRTRYERRELTLGPGESLLFFSDGLPEAKRVDGELLGYDRLLELVRESGEDLDALLARIDAETHEVRDDDQTVVLLKRLG
jgi:hypothetical protein